MTDTVKEKIVTAALKLISEKGYKSTTTRNIAKLAGVNEVTVFRYFGDKKSIVLYALKEMKLIPSISDSILDKCTWDLAEDLTMLAREYYKSFTKDNAKIIIGLRSPEIFSEVKEYLMELPKNFKKVLIKYFEQMYEKKLINNSDFEFLSIAFMSLNFGFILMKASFEDRLANVSDKEFIKSGIKIFIKGITS